MAKTDSFGSHVTERVKPTGSPLVWVLEGEGQAVVDGCDLDAGVLAALRPLGILHTDQFGAVQSIEVELGIRLNLKNNKTQMQIKTRVIILTFLFIEDFFL